MKLRPISLAPPTKDVDLLVYGSLIGEVYGASSERGWHVARRWRDGGPFYVTGTECYSVEVDATCWCPLPETPANEA